jgi:hypothetical protein
MRLRHVIFAWFFDLWQSMSNPSWSNEDLQEWIHKKGYCIDPLCPFLSTERGKKFHQWP